MGGKDAPSAQYYVSTSPPQSPKWAAPQADLLEQRPNLHCSRSRSQSADSVELAMQRQAPEKAPAPGWHSAPASPEQQTKSPRSSGSGRSDGTVSPIRQYMECIEPQTLTCAMVGDTGVGKTSLLLSYTTGKAPDSVNPTIYDKFSSKFKI